MFYTCVPEGQRYFFNYSTIFFTTMLTGTYGLKFKTNLLTSFNMKFNPFSKNYFVSTSSHTKWHARANTPVYSRVLWCRKLIFYFNLYTNKYKYKHYKIIQCASGFMNYAFVLIFENHNDLSCWNSAMLYVSVHMINILCGYNIRVFCLKWSVYNL